MTAIGGGRLNGSLLAFWAARTICTRAQRRVADRAGSLLLALSVAAVLLTGAAGPISAQSPEQTDEVEDRGYYQSYVFGRPDEPSRAWLLAYGGRLYDRWWAVLLRDPPSGTHPSYPEDGPKAGAESWRCVTCHGWGHRGGKHGSGLAGARGADPETIVARLRDGTHRFTPDLLPDQAAMALARFVTEGQPPDAVFDPATGGFAGDATRGREIFQNVCAICHDFDGGAWISGDTDSGASLGEIARGNPARALHIVMNGQTYADMPAMRAFGLATVVDILTHVQTLERRD